MRFNKRNRPKNFFDESAMLNDITYMYHYNRLMEMATNVFEWQNLPDTIDPRFLEMTLFLDGKALFFYDEVLGYLTLQFTMNGGFTPYHVPIERHAFAVNGYHADRTIDDSVIIWNNYTRTNTENVVRMYARRLYNLDRIIDVNANCQKTPGIIQGTEQQRLTLLNLYKEYDGNCPIIFGDKDLDLNALTYISTGAPYVGDKMQELRKDIYGEAMRDLGIANVEEKRERLLKAETLLTTGSTVVNEYVRLNARQEACEEINKMFGLDIWCEYKNSTADLIGNNEDNLDNLVGGNKANEQIYN